ncbi:MAG TPA: hypothetical protein VJN64_11450 [Terriglobales bacterium]|nr:hypothetical protein [Terriglobales bacterium]
MKWGVLAGICGLLLGCAIVQASDGVFQGKIVDPPTAEPHREGWIFVQGRNHMLRRVEVAHAEIVFGDQIPVSQRRKCKMDCLAAGQQIRVTAEQDSSGEWRAKRVEILQLTTNRTSLEPAQTKQRSAPTPT